MSNLRVLENNFYPVKDVDLQVIGRCLPLLQRLLLFAKKLEEVSFKGLICLTNLKLLKHLTFEVASDLNHDGSILLMKKCLVLMPHINALVKMKNSRFAEHEFPRYQAQMELGLEQLVLGENSSIPPNVILPNVTETSISKSLTISLRQFKKLRCMSVSVYDWSQLEEALSAVGQLLKKMSIYGHTCDLIQVLKFCPNLIELNILKSKIIDNFNAPQFTNCVKNLKRFKLNSRNVFDSCGILHLLLTSCPQLEELELNSIKLQITEIDAINEDMKVGAIAIKKLQKLQIMASLEHESVIPFSVFALNLCDKNCHILKEVCIKDHNYDYTNSKYKLAQKVQYFINKHQYLHGLVKILPEHEEILSNFTAQLKNKVRCTSLKILCVRKVADSLPLYVKKGLTKLSHILSKPLFTLVYQEFLETCEDIFNNADFSREDWLNLINPDLVEKVLFFSADGVKEFDCSILNCPAIDSQFQHRVRQFRSTLFERLARGSPRLRSLKDNLHSHVCYYSFPNQLLTDHYSLQLMSNLRVLENNFYPVKNADLQVIGLCLPLLQSLLLFTNRRQDISLEGLKYLTNLKLLKHLTFRVNISRRYNEHIQLVTDCLLLMPGVNTLAKDVNGRLSPHKLPTYEGQVELGLEHLVLGETTAIPSNVTLPNITEITANEETTISLLQFKKLRNMYLSVGDDWSELELPLSKVGHLLRKLSLSFCTCDFAQVLQLCPNLEELKICIMTFVGNFDATQLTNCVQHLKIFKYDVDDLDPKDFLDSRGLLHLLLTSCPELEKLKLRGINLDKPELDLINRDMKAGTSSQKLQKVEIVASVEKVAIVPFSEFIINLCAQNCHILKEVSIIDLDCENKYYEPKYVYAQKMQYFINKHKYLLYLKNNCKF